MVVFGITPLGSVGSLEPLGPDEEASFCLVAVSGVVTPLSVVWSGSDKFDEECKLEVVGVCVFHCWHTAPIVQSTPVPYLDNKGSIFLT